MRFTVDIRCDNAAFDPDAMSEIVSCLQRVIKTLGEGFPSDLYQPILDSNGNDIGAFRLATKGARS